MQAYGILSLRRAVHYKMQVSSKLMIILMVMYIVIDIFLNHFQFVTLQYF